nr:TPA_asm: E7 [Manis javanica papillomavirus 1]
MIGSAPTLKDILLEELPCPVSLVCDEELLPEEEEETEQVQQVPFEVVVPCICGSPLSVYILCTGESLRTFQQLLLDRITFLCANCHQERQNG